MSALAGLVPATSPMVRITEPNGAERTIDVFDMLVVGRDTQGLRLADPSVSRRHLVLRPAATGLTVEDLGSSYGTTVNGRRVTSESALRVGDVIRLGQSVLTVVARPVGHDGDATVVVGALPGAAGEWAAPAAAGPEVPPAVTTWLVDVNPRNGAREVVRIADALDVGRLGTGLVIDDSSISRRHLTFHAHPSGLVVEDVGSSFGTTVNGQRIATAVTLQIGDVVGLGASAITVIGAEASATPATPPDVSPPSAGPVVVPPASPPPAPFPALAPPAPPPVAAPPDPNGSGPDPSGAALARKDRRRIPVEIEPLPPFPNYTQLPRTVPIAAWHPVRAVSVAVYLTLCAVLFVRPDGGLFFFWRLLIPVAPLVFFIAPGLWRNVCPLAASNQTPRLLGFTKGRTMPAWMKERGGGYLIAVALFLVIVPTRTVLFNTGGTATAILLLAVIVAAFVGGTIFKGKSGWCSSHCPMLPVERLYGQTPFVRVPNSHCQPCVGCTKHCYDFNPGVAYQADMADSDPDWSAPRKFFAGAFPGVMVGFFGLTAETGTPWYETYVPFSLAVLASVGLFFLLDGYIRVPTGRIAATFGMAALNLFYWYNAPKMADAWGQVVGTDLTILTWPLRSVVFGLSAWWLVRTVGVEHRFVEEALGKPGVHLSPAATKFLASSADAPGTGSVAGTGPEVRFVPDEKRAVARAGQSILDVAEAAGMPIEVGCRMGMCGADPVAVLEGMEHCSAVEADEANTLRRLGFASTTRLACCARIDGPVSVSLTPERAGTHGTGVFAAAADPDLRRVIVIGNGVAGTTTADFVRRGHPDCEIHVIGREPHPLYNRMGIARLVYGRSAMQGLYLFDDSWYEDRNITSWLNTHASAISLGSRAVQLATGDVLQFDKLVLAMGSSSTVLPLPGWGAPGCFVMREASDAMAMRAFAQTKGVRTAVVAGAGLLGLEAAHALRELGLGVVALDRGPRLMARQSDERCSELLEAYFAGLGIQVLSGTTATELRHDDAGGLTEVVLTDGTSIGAGMFVVCAGITPNIDLARSAGLATNRGVLVNARMETSSLGVYAVGDVAELDGQTPGLWPTAVAQAEVAAGNVLGRDERYDPGLAAVILKGVGLDMTSVGSYAEEPGDELVLIDGPGFEYRKLVVRQGRLVGAILLGRPDDAANVLAAVKKQAEITPLLGALRAGDWRGLAPASLRISGSGVI